MWFAPCFEGGEARSTVNSLRIWSKAGFRESCLATQNAFLGGENRRKIEFSVANLLWSGDDQDVFGLCLHAIWRGFRPRLRAGGWVVHGIP